MPPKRSKRVSVRTGGTKRRAGKGGCPTPAPDPAPDAEESSDLTELDSDMFKSIRKEVDPKKSSGLSELDSDMFKSIRKELDPTKDEDMEDADATPRPRLVPELGRTSRMTTLKPTIRKVMEPDVEEDEDLDDVRDPLKEPKEPKGIFDPKNPKKPAPKPGGAFMPDDPVKDKGKRKIGGDDEKPWVPKLRDKAPKGRPLLDPFEDPIAPLLKSDSDIELKVSPIRPSKPADGKEPGGAGEGSPAGGHPRPRTREDDTPELVKKHGLSYGPDGRLKVDKLPHAPPPKVHKDEGGELPKKFRLSHDPDRRLKADKVPHAPPPKRRGSPKGLTPRDEGLGKGVGKGRVADIFKGSPPKFRPGLARLLAGGGDEVDKDEMGRKRLPVGAFAYESPLAKFDPKGPLPKKGLFKIPGRPAGDDDDDEMGVEGSAFEGGLAYEKSPSPKVADLGHPPKKGLFKLPGLPASAYGDGKKADVVPIVEINIDAEPAPEDLEDLRHGRNPAAPKVEDLTWNYVRTLHNVLPKDNDSDQATLVRLLIGTDKDGIIRDTVVSKLVDWGDEPEDHVEDRGFNAEMAAAVNKLSKKLDDVMRFDSKYIMKVRNHRISSRIVPSTSPDGDDEWEVMRGGVLMFMDYCAEGDLRMLIERHGDRPGAPFRAIPERFIWHIYYCLMQALGNMQTGNVFDPDSSEKMEDGYIPLLHRDIKPLNVFLRPSENPYHFPDPVLADFDLAVRLTPGEGDKPSMTGTQGYHAPEHIRRGRRLHPKRVDGRADIWCVGSMVWDMMNSKRSTKEWRYIRTKAIPGTLARASQDECFPDDKSTLDYLDDFLPKLVRSDLPTYSRWLRDYMRKGTMNHPINRPMPWTFAVLIKSHLDSIRNYTYREHWEERPGPPTTKLLKRSDDVFRPGKKIDVRRRIPDPDMLGSGYSA